MDDKITYDSKDDVFDKLDHVLARMSIALEKSDILQLISGIKEMDELVRSFEELHDIPETQLKQLLAFRVRAKVLLNKISSLSEKGENLIDIIRQIEEDSAVYNRHGNKRRLSTGIDSKG